MADTIICMERSGVDSSSKWTIGGKNKANFAGHRVQSAPPK